MLKRPRRAVLILFCLASLWCTHLSNAAAVSVEQQLPALDVPNALIAYNGEDQAAAQADSRRIHLYGSQWQQDPLKSGRLGSGQQQQQQPQRQDPGNELQQLKQRLHDLVQHHAAELEKQQQHMAVLDIGDHLVHKHLPPIADWTLPAPLQQQDARGGLHQQQQQALQQQQMEAEDVPVGGSTPWQEHEEELQLQQWEPWDSALPPPPPPPPFAPQHPDGPGTEFVVPALPAAANISSAKRRLHQLAPKYCGKLGTYVPNYFSGTEGSMFGVSIAPNADGSVIGVGSPINGPDAKQSGGASVLSSWSDKTCEYAVNPIWQPEGCYKYFGAQVALSTDGTTFVVMDGVEGIKTETAEGNRPVVHVYRRYSNGKFVYMQKLNVAPRRAMASAMSVSITGDAQTIVVSFSVGEGFPDKRGSAQVFVMDGTKANAEYMYLQDLANLNMPAGASCQFGQTSVISNNGFFIAVGTGSNNNAYYNLAYMYKKDEVTGRFRIVSSISSGEHLPDPSPMCSGVGLSESNPVAISQSGQFVLKVENSMLVIYEWSGHGMTVTWKRRCQLQAPDGYTFRTTAGSLSIVEVDNKHVKFAAGAYVGTLETPEQMAVFLYYLDTVKPGTCPYRPAEKHVHNNAFSNYGAGVALTLDGKLLIVGAPTAWDNNMDCQSGAVYLIDICEVADDGLVAKTITQATNTNAGCINGVDQNGNPCVTKQRKDPICKDVKLKDGRIIHYGAPGCTPTAPLTRNFWSASLPGGSISSLSTRSCCPRPQFSTSSLSAYTTVNPSIKGGVGVPTGSDAWLAKQAKAAVQASYFGVPTTAITKPKESIVSAAGWPSSVQPALGGLQSHLNTVGGAAPAPSGISALSLLSSGLSTLLGRASGGAGGISPALGATGAGIGRAIGIGAPVGGPVLPAGAVIRNPEVLKQLPGQAAGG